MSCRILTWPSWVKVLEEGFDESLAHGHFSRGHAWPGIWGGTLGPGEAGGEPVGLWNSS
jgi:hypothetical protein